MTHVWRAGRGGLGMVVIGAILAAGGCTHRVQVDPIRVEPIHLTLDIRLRVDRELDRFFDFENGTPPAENRNAADENGAPS